MVEFQWHAGSTWNVRKLFFKNLSRHLELVFSIAVEMQEDLSELKRRAILVCQPNPPCSQRPIEDWIPFCEWNWMSWSVLYFHEYCFLLTYDSSSSYGTLAIILIRIPKFIVWTKFGFNKSNLVVTPRVYHANILCLQACIGICSNWKKAEKCWSRFRKLPLGNNTNFFSIREPTGVKPNSCKRLLKSLWYIRKFNSIYVPTDFRGATTKNAKNISSFKLSI